ncbi:uncharacterized protein ATNIH1004_009263 [Aspergillus tanneri]|uniref:Uncharacterized protein n=1 Tax=Aspergillus tanneri TaxID=1220188 RepID=A0A5M9MDJ2_9EURO|nr:uncharacterized protein ATNIH1004_009263 [Aspergillus tanneri]KAA8645052.1 hypothetical protein ATNIH1004_009263 [Aspergillus tanneri]
MILRWLRQFLPGTCRSEDITDLERHLDNGLDNATPLPFGQDDARHPIPAPGQVQCADPQSEPTNERSYSLFPRSGICMDKAPSAASTARTSSVESDRTIILPSLSEMGVLCWNEDFKDPGNVRGAYDTPGVTKPEAPPPPPTTG